MPKPNLFYAQSGGVTSVICQCLRGHRDRASTEANSKAYAGLNGIVGALNENLIDTRKRSSLPLCDRHRQGVRQLSLQAEVLRGESAGI